MDRRHAQDDERTGQRALVTAAFERSHRAPSQHLGLFRLIGAQRVAGHVVEDAPDQG